MIRVFLVDDEPRLRRGLIMRLALEPDLEVVGAVGNGDLAIEQVIGLRPDVVLMDVELPGLDGLDATRCIRDVAPHVAVVVLTLHEDAATRARAKQAGAAAFVGKADGDAALLAAIRSASTASGCTAQDGRKEETR